MPENITPDFDAQRTITRATQVDLTLCYTCSSCANGCPVNIATHRLSPLKLVRMAVFGLLDDLLRSPEIWYCLQCNSCLQGCPMGVKPAVMIAYLRQEAIRRRLISLDRIEDYRHLLSGFHRVRWWAALNCRLNEKKTITDQQWEEWFDTPVECSSQPIAIKDIPAKTTCVRRASEQAHVDCCFSCGECRGVCPVSCEPSVFDPLKMFRLINFGLCEEIILSPSLWLCFSCQRCTKFCRQKVEGHMLISSLQKLAMNEGLVDDQFPYRWREVQLSLLPGYLRKINNVLGVSDN